MESTEKTFIIKREPEEEEQPLTFTVKTSVIEAVPEKKFIIVRQSEEENEDE